MNRFLSALAVLRNAFGMVFAIAGKYLRGLGCCVAQSAQAVLCVGAIVPYCSAILAPSRMAIARQFSPGFGVCASVCRRVDDRRARQFSR